MFGMRLKQLRDEKGITQQELANLLNVGRPTIAGYETKGKEPDFDKLIWLANYFDTTVDYLVGRVNVREKPAILSDDKLFVDIYEAVSQLSSGNREKLFELAHLYLAAQGKTVDIP